MVAQKCRAVKVGQHEWIGPLQNMGFIDTEILKTGKRNPLSEEYLYQDHQVQD